MLLNFLEDELKKINAFNTLNEICQQPKVFKKIIDIIEKDKNEIESFMNNYKKEDTRIIFTGAGTSEFIGNSIVHSLIKKHYDAVSVSTTNIVQEIESYIDPSKKTLLVSFARSGNSPESVATFEMMNEFVDTIGHLIITCNKDGDLLKKSKGFKNCFVIVLPEECDDKSFAMTSSYTGMMVSALLIINIKSFESESKKVTKLSNEFKLSIENSYKEIIDLSKLNHDRIVYLGSGDLNGIAQESHLKMLELTSGLVTTFFNTPLGFRHGPKSVLNKSTVVIVFMNRDEYKRKYDFDILKEIYLDKIVNKVIAIDFIEDKIVRDHCHNYIVLKDTNDDVYTGINYISFGQIYGFYKSLYFKKSPDNPCPTGEVNRVVKGVTIYKK